MLGMAAAVAVFHAGSVLSGQMATVDRLRDPGWWPTKGTPPRADYVGAGACAECHRSESATQPSTSMARTAMTARASHVLRDAKRLTFTGGGYSFAIVSDPQPPVYTISNGTQSSSAPLTWAFGAGDVGQSFLFERQGALHEARVSYFASIHALGFTPGRALGSGHGIADAMGRRVDETEAPRCFGCHTTASTAGGKFDPAAAVPGVTCEACHGPGRRHVAAMKQANAGAGGKTIFDPTTLRPAASVDFCGACHATFWDIRLVGAEGTAALRSQPYRLESSRCWTGGDVRLTCVACHNPHEPLVTDPAAYDYRCLSCHARGLPPVPRPSASSAAAGAHPTSDQTAPACPVGTSKCVTCHMPKYAVPDMHREFTDHLIQIVKRQSPAS